MPQRDYIRKLHVIDNVGVTYKGALYNRPERGDGQMTQMTVNKVDVIVGPRAWAEPTGRARAAAGMGAAHR